MAQRRHAVAPVVIRAAGQLKAFFHQPAPESRPGPMGTRVSAAKAGADLEHRGVAIVVDDRLKAARAARAGERGCNPFRTVLQLRHSEGPAFLDFACAPSAPPMG